MSHTYFEAANILNEFFHTAWLANGRDGDVIQFDDKDFDISKMANQAYWARHNFSELSAGQASLAGEVGTRRFSRDCILAISTFTPKNGGRQLARQIVDEVTNIYEGKQVQGIWFRNVRPNPVGPDGQWHQYDILIDVNFDQIK